MASRDLYHSIAATPSIAGQTVSGNATVNGAAVDTQGYESVTVLALIGSRTDGTYAFKLQDCDTSGGTYADVDATCYMAGAAPAGVTAAGALLFGMKDVSASAPTVANQLRRFVRVVETSTGVTTGAVGVSATVLLGHPKHRSVAV